MVGFGELLSQRHASARSQPPPSDVTHIERPPPPPTKRHRTDDGHGAESSRSSQTLQHSSSTPHPSPSPSSRRAFSTGNKPSSRVAPSPRQSNVSKNGRPPPPKPLDRAIAAVDSPSDGGETSHAKVKSVKKLYELYEDEYKAFMNGKTHDTMDAGACDEAF